MEDKNKELDDYKFEKLGEIFEYRNAVFTKYYAYLISVSKKIPVQISNEIRNSFSHLSRAYYAETKEDVDNEARKSQDHIERATRDCLKGSILVMYQNLQNKITDAISQNRELAPSLSSKIVHIKNRRIELLQSEEKGNKALTSELEELVNECIILESELFSAYGTLSEKKLSWLKRQLRRYSRDFTFAVIGAILGWILVKLLG